MSLPALELQDPALAAQIAERSLVISASAGSGKTFALVTLVLGDLGRGGRPQHIVATTFGREAAADLRARILLPLDQLAAWDIPTWHQAFDALHQGFPAWDAWLAALEPKVRPELGVAARQWLVGEEPQWLGSARQAREHWIRVRREAELLQATTVHSLALALLRRRGLGFEEVLEAEDPSLLRLLRRAGREVLDLPETDSDAPAARRLWAWCEGFEEGRDRWSALAAAFDGHLDALGTWRGATDAAQPRGELLREGHRLLAAYAPFAQQPARAAQLTKQGKVHGSFTRFGLAKVQPEPEGPPMAILLESLERMAGRFLKDSDGLVPTYFAEEFQESLEPLTQALPTALEAWMTLLLERVFQRFRDLKAERGLRSYGDLVRQAWETLGEHPETQPPALLLIDEYQDVNPVQQAFLEALGAQRMVRVGDPKQAIYGFRGGVPELLRQQLHQASQRGEAYRLGANHRSSAPVVELANRFVEDLVPALDEASFDPDGVQTYGARGLGEPRVGLVAVPTSKIRGGDLPAASPWIGALARDAGWVAAGFAAPEAGPRRRALLLPRRTGLPALRRALQAAQIEPLVQSREGFWASPGVRLLMALLETIARPEAPGPRLAVLRSPWVGATDGELAAFREDAPVLCPSLEAGLTWLESIADLDTQGIVASGLARPGLLELIAATAVHGALEPARARRNLEHFLGWVPTLPAVPALAWARLRQRRAFEDPGDAPAEAAAADLVVQTIHGAKGLEYEDVILPMLADSVKGVRKGTVRQRPGQGLELWMGWKLGRARGPALQELRAEEERRTFREGLNLLYVGLTRARDRLLLIQQWSQKEGVPEAPPGAVDRRNEGKSVYWQHVATELAAICPEVFRIEGPPPVPQSTEPVTIPPLVPPRDSVPLPLMALGPAPEAPERIRKGIQIHALLREVLVREGIDPQQARTYLAQHPLIQAWPKAESMVVGFLNELQERGWTSLPRRTEFELEHAGKSGGQGRADLVIWEPLRQAPTRIRVVDFKLAASFSEETLGLHRQQLGAYRQTLAQHFPLAQIEAWVVGLEGGLWVNLFPE